MKEDVRRIYLKLMAAIAEIENLNLPESTLIEKKFVLCFKSWETVKTRENKFVTEFEEIDFFRNTKPLFTSLIEYCKILNEAQIFSPADPSLKWAYWNKELGRYARFCDRHKEFVAYYESGSREKDGLYFLTRNYNSQKDEEKIYDTDTAFCTNGDHMVASLHALSLYKEYVGGMLRKLMQGVTPGANTDNNS